MKRTTLTVFVIALLAIAGSGILFLSQRAEAPTSTNNSTSNEPAQGSNGSQATIKEQDNSADAAAAATITYSNDGFSPGSVNIKAGETVEIKNTSSRSVQFDSDPHPVHTDNTELNVDLIAPGTSKKFKVNKTGTWGYHNHLDSSERGTIVVQ